MYIFNYFCSMIIKVFRGLGAKLCTTSVTDSDRFLHEIARDSRDNSSVNN